MHRGRTRSALKCLFLVILIWSGQSFAERWSNEPPTLPFSETTYVPNGVLHFRPNDPVTTYVTHFANTRTNLQWAIIAYHDAFEPHEGFFNVAFRRLSTQTRGIFLMSCGGGWADQYGRVMGRTLARESGLRTLAARGLIQASSLEVESYFSSNGITNDLIHGYGEGQEKPYVMFHPDGHERGLSYLQAMEELGLTKAQTRQLLQTPWKRLRLAAHPLQNIADAPMRPLAGDVDPGTYLGSPKPPPQSFFTWGTGAQWARAGAGLGILAVSGVVSGVTNSAVSQTMVHAGADPLDAARAGAASGFVAGGATAAGLGYLVFGALGASQAAGAWIWGAPLAAYNHIILSEIAIPGLQNIANAANNKESWENYELLERYTRWGGLGAIYYGWTDPDIWTNKGR
jgi:hypothetical protein